ncbi:MAG: Gfo/Idh/MocA family oxidoreductase [Clostridia bacterium]|nr:Gfo/Idh/MocA family oxidoreductase [Clostridia bacterium]
MENKIKIVCVGIGGYASVYWKALFADTEGDFEIVGAVDPFPEGSPYYEEIKTRGIPLYSNMEDFYREHSADLAIITTPIHLHTRQTLFALEHGSNVLCEKPLSGVSTDAEVIEKRAAELGKFVMIGYQWSYAPAILGLKSDVLSGKLGAPVSLKTRILWPRKKEYFTRGSGWAGKLKAKDGTVINDSVAANACAHYIHNMLFVCGKEYLAAEPLCVKADLIRVNAIENFDNATISFELENGAKCLFVAAHSSNINRNPMFDYEFENATVKYDENTKDIVAYFKNGEEKHYGNPFSGGSDGKKARVAINGCKAQDFKPVCSPYTAAAHTRCIEAVQTFPIYEVKEEFIKENEGLLYVDGLAEAMTECYAEGKMLSETEAFKKWVK